MYFNPILKSKIIYGSVCAALIGAIFFFTIYGETLRPTYDAWLLSAQSDPTQPYIGWVMYRVSPWTFPVGIAQNYGYPSGIPITFTDSVPLFALVFKIIRSVLPTTFQYLGIWMLVSLVLQGIFGFLLSYRALKKYIPSILASILFVVSPIVWFRLGGHFALGGQWIVLSAIWLVVRRHSAVQWWQWSLVLVLSLLIHPYFVFMNAIFMAVDGFSIPNKARNKKIHYTIIALFFVFQILVVVSASYCVGIFEVQEAAAEGFGSFSMNINSLVNPVGWSRFLPNLPLVNSYQMEGFNYFGLGSLILIIFSSIYFLFVKKSIIFLQKKYIAIFVGMFVCTLIALSSTITLNQHILLDIHLPQQLQPVVGLARSSGRLFWPVYYLILCIALYVFRFVSVRKATVVIALCVIVQIVDVSPQLTRRGSFYEGRTWQTALVSDFWIHAADTYRHIIFLPTISMDSYADFAIYASQHGLTLNSGYFARTPDNIIESNNLVGQEFARGVLRDDTLYIITDITKNPIDQLEQANIPIEYIDNYIVIHK